MFTKVIKILFIFIILNLLIVSPLETKEDDFLNLKNLKKFGIIKSNDKIFSEKGFNYKFSSFSIIPKTSGKYGNAKSTTYIANNNSHLILASASGLFYKVNINDLNNKYFPGDVIPTNIKKFINIKDFSRKSAHGIKGILINEDKIYVSLSNIKKVVNNKKCFNVKIISANFSSKYLNFTEFYNPEECSFEDQWPFFTGHVSGNLISIKDKILFTSPFFGGFEKPQSLDSIFGKTISIDKFSKQVRIISLGHRNSQGLSFDIKNNILYSTDHGPQGGDEINIVEDLNFEVPNFGWPIASYGIHYEYLSDEDLDKLYQLAPLKKTHHELGFKEPIYIFNQSIGITQILPFFNKKDNKTTLFVGALGNKISEGDMSINIISFKNKFLFDSKSVLPIGERIRDMLYLPNLHSIILTLESSGSLGVLKLPKELKSLEYR